MINPPDAADKRWDAIIIGTGVGGATLGYALARGGQRVLFCEKGKSQVDPQAIRGAFAELHCAHVEPPEPTHRDILSRAGRYSNQVRDRSTTKQRMFVPFIGSGTGGSSALYGMAMERFLPADFEPRRCHANASETTLPDHWPISYAELAPYYAAAEVLYRVRGAADPLGDAGVRGSLRPPPALTPLGSELFDFFTRQGLHPYRLPMACEFVAGCKCCQGYLCDHQCKNDSSRMCLEPAVSLHGAALLDECEVLSLESTTTEITGVLCKWRGKQMRLLGKIVVLAAGALESPCILLRSASNAWPKGLANASGLVGRNFMRHHVDLYLFSPLTPPKSPARQKEVAVNDFYYANGKKLGTLQSFGPLPPASVLIASMEDDLRHGAVPLAGFLLGLAKPMVAPILRKAIQHKSVLATVMEDLPYDDNRVSSISAGKGDGEGRVEISYKIRPHDLERIAAFRALITNLLKPYRVALVKQAEKNHLLAHACGTCRFGLNARESVLDPDNRAHGISNLYVVDSSFFPSSGGTNPALTIAANALRVADTILGKQR